MKHFHIFIFLKITVVFLASNAAIIGEPKIKCAPTGITIMMEADIPFKGALFLKGSTDRKSCKADFSSQPSQNISFEFSFDECPSRRKRQIVQPRGLTMSSVLIVSYHGSIITHRDVAYQIDCFYREENSRVETLLNVTAPVPRVLSDKPTLPTCDYRVEVAGGVSRSGGVVTSSLSDGNSPVVSVGESVIHIWSCSGDAPSDIYCMQVYNCTAEDGDADQVQVVDSNGCTTDGELLSPIKYKGGAMRAAASSQAFKFADKQTVYFKCSIRMTVKTPSEECPINNCAPSGATGSVSRQRRAYTSPLFMYHRQPIRQTIDINVNSGELIVEAEEMKNHLMSTYRPEMYSYSPDIETTKNHINALPLKSTGSRCASAVCAFLALFLFFTFNFF